MLTSTTFHINQMRVGDFTAGKSRGGWGWVSDGPSPRSFILEVVDIEGFFAASKLNMTATWLLPCFMYELLGGREPSSKHHHPKDFIVREKSGVKLGGNHYKPSEVLPVPSKK